jgi:hypothetical protein
MKTIIFWLLKIAEILGVLCILYIIEKLGYIVYCWDFNRQFIKPALFWSGEGLIMSFLCGIVIILGVTLFIILTYLIFGKAIPQWIKLNKKWANKIYKRIKLK